MLVTGLNEHEQLCSTADPHVRALSVALASRVHYADNPPTHDEAVVFLPLTGIRSVEDLVEYMAEFEGEIPANHLRNTFNLAASLLLYLCSDRRDVREYRPPAGGRGKKKRRGDGGFVVDLGFHVGPALHAARTLPRAGTAARQSARTCGGRTGTPT
jgi:hypothetical protein